MHSDLARERDELVVAGDKVGVAVDLDEHSNCARCVDVGLHGPFGGFAVGELAELVAHLDAQNLGRPFSVAVGLH